MIRLAEITDFWAMIGLGAEFHAKTVTRDFTPWDDNSFAETLQRLMESEHGHLIVYEANGRVEGMAAAILQPSYFNKHYRTCHELFCWVNPSERGAGMKLFDVLESWGKENGAHTMIISSVPNLRADVLDRKYRAMGYVLTDNFYTKVL